MSVKKVLIIYRNKNFESLATAERNYHRVVGDMIEDGYKVIFERMNATHFTDGSYVEKIEFDDFKNGRKAEEIYIDESILKMANGLEFVKSKLYPILGFDKSEEYKKSNIKIFSKDGLKSLDEYQ